MDADRKHIPQAVRLDIVFYILNRRALPSHKAFPTEHYFASYLDTCHN